MACASACAAFAQVNSSLMCVEPMPPCSATCPAEFNSYPMCETSLLAFYNCLGDEISMASCSCDPMLGAVCTGVCTAEFAAANMCTMM